MLGAPSGEPPVVLHHGFVADANLNWAGPGVVAALVAAGRYVVAAPDARGHGASSKPHDPAAYGEGAMARDLGTLFDVIGADAVDLAGYDGGGRGAAGRHGRQPGAAAGRRRRSGAGSSRWAGPTRG